MLSKKKTNDSTKYLTCLCVYTQYLSHHYESHHYEKALRLKLKFSKMKHIENRILSKDPALGMSKEKLNIII